MPLFVHNLVISLWVTGYFVLWLLCGCFVGNLHVLRSCICAIGSVLVACFQLTLVLLCRVGL